MLSYIDSNQKFPYVNNFSSKHSAEKAPKHIFVLMMESFSSTWVDQLAGNGKEVTPFFNSLKKKGIYFDTFYSNSMQTERGHSAMICSIIPSYRAKIMTSYIDNHFRCLPEILNEAGYTSIYIQAHQGLKFDNTGNFMQRIGFQNVLSMDEKFVKPDEKGLVWGWGLQDDRFYQKYFKYLDDLHAVDSKAKFFSVLATISNHQGFDDMPNDQKFLYSEPQSFTQAFQNSIHLADIWKIP